MEWGEGTLPRDCPPEVLEYLTLRPRHWPAEVPLPYLNAPQGQDRGHRGYL